jgi:hypothetical protein
MPMIRSELARYEYQVNRVIGSIDRNLLIQYTLSNENAKRTTSSFLVRGRDKNTFTYSWNRDYFEKQVIHLVGAQLSRQLSCTSRVV